MGRGPQCSKDGFNKGAWTSQEDKTLIGYVKIHGEGKWSNVAKRTGLKRCGKSCRLRWMNYLRPDIKRGNITVDEEELIVRLHKLLGNRWSLIAGRLPGRTDNEIKNYWNTNLAKKSQDHMQLTIPKLGSKQEQSPRPHDNNKLSDQVPTSQIIVPNRTEQLESHHYQDHQILNAEPATNDDNQWLQIGNNDHHLSSNGASSPLSFTSGDEIKSSDQEFIMDFNMDDFCKILDSEFTKLHENDVHLDKDENNFRNVVAGDDAELAVNNGCTIAADLNAEATIKLEENNCCAGSEEPGSTDGSDFMSLVSFLDSVPAEWQEMI